MALSRKHKKLIDEITGNREVKKIKGMDFKKQSKAPLNKIYYFSYPNPVTKNRLDYWFETPLIVILARRGNKVLGLSLMHLTYTFSVKFSRELARKIKNKKRAIRYEDIKAAMRAVKIPQSMMYFALRAYRLDRISGSVYVLNMDEFGNALKKLPRTSKKMGLAQAIKFNMAKYYEFIKKQKEKSKGKK